VRIRLTWWWHYKTSPNIRGVPSNVMANPNLVMQSHSNDKSSSIQKCADSKAARVYMAFAFFTEYRALYVEL